MEAFIGLIIGIVLLFIIVKIFAWPIKMLIKLIVNAVLGAVLLWLVNLFGVGIGINMVTSLIAGVLGIPGVIFLVILKLFM